MSEKPIDNKMRVGGPPSLPVDAAVTESLCSASRDAFGQAWCGQRQLQRAVRCDAGVSKPPTWALDTEDLA